ncbi:MAG: glycosyltransferase family 10 domain-containing protein [Rhodoferax sp.]
MPDWLVVYEGWRGGNFSTRVPKERRILICAEPESFHRYQPHFLTQFGHVFTTQRGTRHPGVIYTQPAISWFVGVRFGWEGVPNEYPLKFEDFETGNPSKTKLCSVVCSNKAVSKGHRQRLAFVERLQHELGDQIDVYGRGFREVRDKDEALADYRFHIAIENSSSTDYWTEKLADPLLRGCFPIYAGCPNLDDYFPAGSYVRIDINQTEQAIQTIRAVLQGQLDREQAVALAEAKRRVLWEHNMLPMMERLYPKLEQGLAAPRLLDTAESLKSDHECKDLKWSRKMRRALRNWFKK